MDVGNDFYPNLFHGHIFHRNWVLYCSIYAKEFYCPCIHVPHKASSTDMIYAILVHRKHQCVRFIPPLYPLAIVPQTSSAHL